MNKNHDKNGETNQNPNTETPKPEGFAKRWFKRTWRYALGGAVGAAVTTAVFMRAAAKNRDAEAEEPEEEEESDNSEE